MIASCAANRVELNGVFLVRFRYCLSTPIVHFRSHSVFLSTSLRIDVTVQRDFRLNVDHRVGSGITGYLCGGRTSGPSMNTLHEEVLRVLVEHRHFLGL